MKPRYLQSPNTSTPPRPPGNKTPGSSSSRPGALGVGGGPPGSSGASSSSSVPHHRHFRRTSSGVPTGDDSENYNPEDVHKSLRSTANAIQNYSFDSPGILNESKMRFDFLDSGSGGGGAGGQSKGTPTLEEKMSLLDMSSGGRSSMDRFSPARNGGGEGGVSPAVSRNNAENEQRGRRKFEFKFIFCYAIWDNVGKWCCLRIFRKGKILPALSNWDASGILTVQNYTC